MRPTLKRWQFWLTVLVLLPTLFVSIGLIYCSQSPINQANFNRIQEEMAEEQVIAILGEPTSKHESFLSPYVKIEVWQRGPDVISIILDGRDKVYAKEYNPPTAWQRLRWHIDKWLVRIGIGQE